MKRVTPSSQFRRDLKRAVKQGRKIDTLGVVVDLLATGKHLSAHHRPHKLNGEYNDAWECHIGPDWLLVYQLNEESVFLIRVGSHTELFD